MRPILATLLVSLAARALASDVSAMTGHAATPTLSPDGRWLAWEVDDFRGEIRLAIAAVNDLRLTDARVIEPPNAGPFARRRRVALQPTWHPTGALLFEGTDAAGRLRLWTIQPEGGAPLSLVAPERLVGHLQYPTLSSEGSDLAFVARATLGAEVFVRDLDSPAVVGGDGGAGAPNHPHWAAAGDRLVLSRQQPETGQDLFIRDAQTGEEAPLLLAEGDQTRPVFARGDSIVLFFDNSADPSRWDLAAVDTSLGATQLIAENVALPLRARPAISADGAWVAWTSAEPALSDALFIAQVDGSQATVVSVPQLSCQDPTFGRVDDQSVLAYTALSSDSASWREPFIVDITQFIRGQNPEPTIK